MSSYQLTLALSSGVYTPTLRRAGTPASGGTAITVPAYEAAVNTTKHLPAVMTATIRAIMNDLAANGAPSNRYDIDLADSSGTFTPTVRKDGTAASGGTTITLPWVSNNSDPSGTTLDTASPHADIAAFAGFRGALNDRAAGN